MAKAIFISPMLATLTKEPFNDKQWLYEEKFDGVRCIVVKEGKQVNIYSRNKRKLNAAFPDALALFEKQKHSFVIDAEICAYDKKITSFSKLQPRIHVKSPSKELIRSVPITVHCFDLLHFNGKDLKKLPLIERKKKLKTALSYSSKLRFTTHKKDGLSFFKSSCKKGGEGVIAKEANSTYVSKRTRHWLKFKCSNRQEFVIGGYTKPQGKRVGYGALLIGYYEKGKFKFAGKVGTGGNEATLKKIASRLQKLHRSSSPFSDFSSQSSSTYFVRPSLVAEIGFSEWTKDGKLRHPRFYGLRADKKAFSVKRERK